MQLDTYLRALVRMWYVPVLLLVIGLVSVYAYHKMTDKAGAEAKVTVISAKAAPGEFVPAQVPFDVLGDSEDLAKRVAARLNDGTTADQISGKISIKLSTALNRSPYYVVSASDKSSARAVKIANITVEEAQKLFVEINTPNPKDVRAAYQPELDRAQTQVDSARSALAAFESANDAYELPTRRDQLLALTSQLSNLSTTAGSGGGSDSTALRQARAELQRLTSLGGQYDKLTFDLGLAKDAVTRLDNEVAALRLSTSPQAQAALADLQQQLNDAKTRETQAEQALAGFQQTNSVSDLPAAIQTQLGLVNQLSISNASGLDGSAAAQAELTQAQAELKRLQGLEPQYDQLTTNLKTAENQLASVQQQVESTVLGQTLPADSRVKVLEGARLQSNLFWDAITYLLGVALALFLGLTAVYILAFFERAPLSIHELEREFGESVLVQVPRAGAQ